ncbi:hypothetical protein [Haloplanus rallus]|nr:hypothetical protein [Haloplanus rallus]
MKVVRPYVDENMQLIFVELKHELLHDLVNGALLALLVVGPLSLFLP